MDVQLVTRLRGTDTDLAGNHVHYSVPTNLVVYSQILSQRLDIDKLATAGVTKGCNPPDNDRFCPTQNVTRGQMAALLHRALS